MSDFPRVPRSTIDLILKAETEGLDTETEYFAYIWTLVTSGLVNSTGSMQRLVADFTFNYGEGWETACKEAYDEYFTPTALDTAVAAASKLSPEQLADIARETFADSQKRGE